MACETENASITEAELQLNKMMETYYYSYYLHELGLSDYSARIQNRFREEELFARPNIEKIQCILGREFDAHDRVLVLGGGTGAEFVVFSELGCDTYVLEPNDDAIAIMQKKCEIRNLDKHKVYKGFAEKLPFQDDFFDFVYCFTVLEHVQNVEQTVKEAIRVTKNDGYLYFITPDYRQFYEGHYKMHLPMFLPKWIIKLILRLRGRPASFLDSLQFVTAKQLRNLFRDHGVTAMQLYFPYKSPDAPKSCWGRIIRFMQDALGVEKDQFWLLKKI